MTFDERAQRAAHGLKRAVGGVLPPPIDGAGVVAPPSKMPIIANLLQAAAALVVVVLAVGYFSAGGFFAPFFGEALTPLDTTATTVASLETVLDEPSTPTTMPEAPPTTVKTTDTEAAKPTEPAKDYQVVILSPDHGSETDDEVILVKGEATPELHVVVNGRVAVRDGDGHWQIEVKLKEGWNAIQAKGFVGDHKAVSDTIEVLFVPPPTTTKPKPAPTDYAVHITSPADGAKVDGETLLVKGEATPGVTVVVNGITAEWTDSAHWKVTVPIKPGWNGIAAKAYKGETKVAYHAIEVLNGEPQSVGIISPAHESVVMDASVLVKGEATAGLTVYVNGLAVEWTDATHWKVTVPLNPGWNEIIAKGYIGETKVAIASVAVHQGEIVPFTVTQMYGSCSENPPYETFYGTATPNGKVWIQSPYGEKTVYADAAGNWEATIYFEGVPSGKTFEISVKDYAKHEYKYFTFTYTG